MGLWCIKLTPGQLWSPVSLEDTFTQPNPPGWFRVTEDFFTISKQDLFLQNQKGKRWYGKWAQVKFGGFFGCWCLPGSLQQVGKHYWLLRDLYSPYFIIYCCSVWAGPKVYTVLVLVKLLPSTHESGAFFPTIYHETCWFDIRNPFQLGDLPPPASSWWILEHGNFEKVTPVTSGHVWYVFHIKFQSKVSSRANETKISTHLRNFRWHGNLLEPPRKMANFDQKSRDYVLGKG